MRTTMALQRAAIFSTLTLLAACGAEGEPTNAPKPVEVRAADAELERLDRTQASYATTVFHTADGLRLPKGNAWLTIHESQGEARFALKLAAVASSTEQLAAHFDFDRLDLTSGKVRLEHRVAPGFRGNVKRHRGSEVEASVEADLSLALSAATGQRTMLVGDISTSNAATSANFRTELLVSCFVRPESLGRTGNGAPDPAGAAGHELVEDVNFESSFCRRYGYLR